MKYYNMTETTYKEWCKKQMELGLKITYMSQEEAIKIGKASNMKYLCELETRADEMIQHLNGQIIDLIKYSTYKAKNESEKKAVEEQTEGYKRIRNRIDDIHHILEYYIRLKGKGDRYATRDICGNIVEAPTSRATWAHTYRQ